MKNGEPKGINKSSRARVLLSSTRTRKGSNSKKIQELETRARLKLDFELGSSSILSSIQARQGTNRRVKDIKLCVLIVYGTIAFYLGRKASESQSHKWIVYVRGVTNEDLGAVIKHVVFQLHPSFNNLT
ncbi:hypothetical protein F3Y22_tig00116997pilonHSYRG00823 [Hibiscus syriacus]|uniref:YEATS domain-containing protein n=1 Tax=Hibiscus syriacus TaxID=106335 RepID=A0A6A2WM29_HIBSY|nr:hypothetical protein F3Y22_tig00116997pilonHSYRG00823 [Hibiscus syriacus]